MPDAAHLQRILKIETLALHAWPAAEVWPLGGWQMRYTQGVTRRANSVWPNQEDPGTRLSLDQRLDAVEDFYRWRGQPAEYQICTVAQPADLDAVLARRGYAMESPTHVQVTASDALLAATPPASDAPGPGSVTLAPTLGADWLTAYGTAEHVAVRDLAVRAGILARIAPPTAFAMLSTAQGTVATGLGVLDGGWLGVFSMTTVSTYRRRGAASAVLHALTAWAVAHGEDRVYLQVATDNLVAQAMYHRLGFTTLYMYHYRRRPLTSL